MTDGFRSWIVELCEGSALVGVSFGLMFLSVAWLSWAACKAIAYIKRTARR